MAEVAGGVGRSGETSGRRPEPPAVLAQKEAAESLNDRVLERTYLLTAVTGLGYLALLWSTVVLLGGFVTSLQKKDFWSITVISMIQASRIFNDLADHMFPSFMNRVKSYIRDDVAIAREEIHVTFETFRQMPILSAARSTWWRVGLILLVAIIYGPFLAVSYMVFFLYGFGPISCIALALWRVRQHDYGSTDGDTSKANLMPAQNIFYSLVLCQGAFYSICSIIDFTMEFQLNRFRSECWLPRKGWIRMSLVEYFFDTQARCWRDPASINGRTLSHYAVDLLDSGSWEDNLSGARMLSFLIKQGNDLRPLLLPSRQKIQKLIDTLGWKHGPQGTREMRELAASIVVHLAGDIHLAQFPGAIPCICSLLKRETIWSYWNSYEQGRLCPPLETSPEKQDMFLRLQKIERKDSNPQLEEVGGSSSDGNGGGGCNNMILQGLNILERLASDHQNCNDICSTPGFLPKITAPLYSNTLVQDISISAWKDIVNGTFKVLYTLIQDHGETGRMLRQEISSNKQAVNNLERILHQDNTTGSRLQMRAMMILTELAADMSANLAKETKDNLIKKQMQTFLADEEGGEVAATYNRHKTMAANALAFLSTNSETNSGFIMSGCDDIVAGLTEKLDAKNNNIYRTKAANILGNLCAHCALDHEHVKETLLPKVLTEVLSTAGEPPQSTNSALENHEENQKFSATGKDEENPHNISSQEAKTEIQEISSARGKTKSSDNGIEKQTGIKALQEALLSLILVIYDKQISADDFDDVVKKAQGHSAFVERLKDIVEENCQATVVSLRIVKLCGQIAESMMQHDQYIEHFRNKEFVESLSKASKIMSSLESCMLFAGTDFGPNESIRPLLSDIERKVQQLVEPKL